VRIVQANAVYDATAKTPSALLEQYRTLTEWSDAVAAAGASVSVVQRFRSAAQVDRDGIRYQFVADTQPPWLSTAGAPPAFVEAIAAQSPDLVHVNGLIFPGLVAAIRQRLGAHPAIVVQHHGGEFPVRGSGLVGMFDRRRWRNGLAAADAVSFTAIEQAEPWRQAGVIGSQKIIAIIEASTTMREVARDRTRLAIGVNATPVILWVGRLTSNKDPISVLDGIERALPQLPSARVVMVFGDDTLLHSVEQRVRDSALLSAQVTLAGRVSHEEMPNYYAAADIFVSGSHSEGSGYALIEAMSAGVVPVVTEIPSFVAITGAHGWRWAPGDGNGCRDALLQACRSNLVAERASIKSHFDRELSWHAIGAKTLAAYQAIVEAKRSA
jgi:glycosyltransferase involved in cell wall biosynthesis